MSDRKIRVAFVDYVLDPTKPGRSGLSDIVWDLGHQLADHHVEVHIIGSYHTTIFPSEHVEVHNFATPIAGYRNIIGNLLLLRRAAKVIRTVNPDIIHAPEYISTWALWLFGIRTPMVLTVPGNIFYRETLGKDTGYEWYFRQILKMAALVSAKRCAVIIAVSNEMRYWWLKTGSRPESTPVIPLGASSARFKYVEGARERLDLPEHLLTFIYVGRFSPEKGVMLILDAVDLVEPELLSSIRIVLIGNGPQKNTIVDRIQNRMDSSVVVKDWVNQDELSMWYSAADAVILPSRSEACARTLLESMMCGTPVIATCMGGAKDLVREGESGFLFDSGDARGLASIFENLAGNPNRLKTMRPVVTAFAKENLSWDVIAEKVVQMVYVPTMKLQEGYGD